MPEASALPEVLNLAEPGEPTPATVSPRMEHIDILMMAHHLGSDATAVAPTEAGNRMAP